MRVLTTFLILAILSACTKNRSVTEEGEFRYSFSVKAIKEKSASPEAAAEDIAKGAEQLLTAKGFEQAYSVATEALALDPKNLRAGFIQALLRVLLLEKGILIRLQPLGERSKLIRNELDKHIDWAMANPNETLNSYYLDGKPDISNERELQSYIDNMIAALESFRIFVRDRRDSEITMISNPIFIPDSIERYVANCVINETENQSYELICPPGASRRQVKLNRADFEEFQYGAAFYELYLALPNGYRLTGSVDALKDIEKLESSDVQKVVDAVMAHAAFGDLRLPNSFTKARGWGVDLVNSLSWALDNQKLTCRKGTFDATNRPGYYFHKGVCVASVFKEYIDKANHSVRSQDAISIAYKNGRGEKSNLRTNIWAPFERPIANLKQLGPMKFNNCGNLSEIQDRSMGGLFPDMDIAKILAGPECR